jgi:2-octaprenylphenol hydroxylase
MFDFDVVIVGGGVAACLSALLSAQKGLKVVLIRHAVQTPQTIDSRVFALSQSTWDHLNRWGIHLKNRPSIVQMDEMQLFFSHDPHHPKTKPYRINAWESNLPALAYLCPMNELYQACIQALSQQLHITMIDVQGDIQPETMADGWQLTIQRVAVDTPIVIKTACLIIAEGNRSPLRQAMGFSLEWGNYAQSSVVSQFVCSTPHRGIASQWFIETPSRTGDIVALLPTHSTTDGQPQVSLVWSTSTPPTAENLAQALKETIGGSLHEVYGQLTQQGGSTHFPLWRAQAPQVTTHHALLLGDSAASIHPLAGMGFNLVISDLLAWEKTLEKLNVQTKQPLGGSSMLAHYQRRMKAQRWPIETAVNGIYSLTRPQHRALSKMMLKGIPYIPASWVSKTFHRASQTLFG